MIVVKLRDGSLWVNSPVEPSPDVLTQVRGVGPIRYLVAPTPMHIWRLEPWITLLPLAQLWGPPKARSAPANRPFAGLLGDVAPTEWAEDIEQVVFRGNVFLDEVEFFHKSSRTLIVADFIQNYPAVKGDVLGNFVKMLGGVRDGGVPRDIRWSITDRRKARASLAKLLAWDFDKAIVAHGACVEHDAKPFVETAFRWLSG